MCCSLVCLQNRPDPSMHGVHSSSKSLLWYPVPRCLQQPVCPAHTTNARLDLDLGNLELKLTPKTCEQIIPDQHFVLWQCFILPKEAAQRVCLVLSITKVQYVVRSFLLSFQMINSWCPNHFQSLRCIKLST